jgi:V8-like Glu-specific endopeptidase
MTANRAGTWLAMRARERKFAMTHHRRSIVSLSFSALCPTLLPFLLVACSGGADAPTAADSDSIVGGRRDRADRAVIALSIGGEGLCSGSLIAKNVVLTARHCVSDTSESVGCPADAPQISADRDPSTLTVLVGNDIATATPVALGRALIVPPSNVLCDNDIALVELDRPVPGVTPAQVNLDNNVVRGERLRMVGFGKRGDQLGAGKKYQRSHVPVLDVSRSELMVGEVSCNGDSGGPAFDEETQRIVGVVSRGGPDCQGSASRNIYTRVDRFAALIRRAIAHGEGTQD